ncbi:MAG: PIN domain-containing protein [Firmicutes bacterium]|nr:PIN domain-containing protein [Bacillota bacterium]
MDTSAWYSLMDAADGDHGKVGAAYIEAYQNGNLFVTSNLVLGELYTLLTARTGRTADFWLFRERVAASRQVQILDLGPQQIDAAFDLLWHRQDKLYSFVDATSFVLMRDEAIHNALTLDRHFAQEGFLVTPALGEVLHESGETYE